MRSPLCGLIFIFFMTGCASIGRHRQFVLVRSEPSGAKIFQNDQLIARTPAIFSVQRRAKMDLQLELGSETRALPLQVNYRWLRSGLGNLVFLNFAPIGWVVDWMTGAAWEYEPEHSLRFSKNVRAGPPDLSSEAIAVAPPMSIHGNVSDEAGRKLVLAMRDRFKNENVVLAYDQTLPKFLNEDVDFDNHIEDADKIELYGRLGVRKIYFSTVYTDKSNIRIEGHLEDILTPQKNSREVFEFKPDEIPSVYKVGWLGSDSKIFYFLPNTLAFDAIYTHSSLTIDLKNVDAQSGYTDDLWGQISRYLSVVSLRRVMPPIHREDWRYRLVFVPTASFSRAKEIFPDSPLLETYQFERTHSELGYGPSFTYSSIHWTLYFNFMMALTYDSLKLTDGERSFSSSRADVNFGMELGAIYHFNSNWHLRLFSRGVQVSDELWEKTLKKATNEFHDIGSADLMTAGISLGYTFPNTLYNFK